MPPIQLHPQNPHYFLFRGKPAVLVTSGEHYGAVLNLDFDFFPYLAELHRNGFNLTRTWVGAYCEKPGNFNIANNTLAPLEGRFITPWVRSAVPGYPNGGNKFDLSRWDEAYFRRLKEFVRQAGDRGVVVEMVLFCPYYEDSMWDLSPLKASNNIQGVGDVPRTEALTLKHPRLVAVQDAMVRKVVQELAPFDNVYFEICNEPYFGGVTLDWQAHVAATIREAERDLPSKHLIAQNIANGSAKIENPNPAVSLFNFHYASPPDAVRVNWDLHTAIGFDETGFRGTHDLPYRTDAWEFLLAGGSTYDNLDYSFTAAHPGGTAEVHDPTPGGGGPALRKELGILKEFLESFDFLKMTPDVNLDVIQRGIPDGATARVLSEKGRQYAIYLKGGHQATLTLELPPGRYHAEWVDTKTGDVARAEDVEVAAGGAGLTSPSYTEDIALRVRRK